MTRARDIANFGDGIATADIDDGAVTAGKLNSTLDLTGKTVTLPSGTGGKVLQVVQTVKTDTYASSASNGAYDITGLSVNITPSSASNKILVTAQVNYDVDGSQRAGLLLVRDTTDLFIGDTSGSRARVTIAMAGLSGVNELSGTQIISYLDSPSKTTSTTYKVKAIVCDSGAVYVNRSDDNTDAGSVAVGTSSITVMEVAG